ncbi:hypothetical protein D6C85_09706 [Aureobasidium pullulans]|uniref:Uncharacterized protein n=1 Tax=Aureobasidium pullulans TaxID=5580 RepID=A0A4S9W703_AURPU|nr:hypothetical protein D6C85_09706 [Aureobasidium pullulans]
MSAFPILSFLAFLATRRTEVDPEYEHIYTTLTTFVSRGQTVVEDIPPLSLLVGSNNSAESLQSFAVAVEYLRLLVWTSLTYCHVVSVQKRRMMYGLMVIAFLVPVLLFDSGHEHLSPAQTAATLGELFYTIALATTMIGRDKAQSNGLTRTICLDSMLAISFLLGCQDSNWIITMILHQLDQLLDFWQRLGDKSRTLVWTFGGAVSRVLLRITISLALVFVVLSFTYPISERAAGGNWNLRYLPAETRRFLRGITRPQTLVTDYAIPRYAIMPDTPKSLYLQGAGFLYTDDWTWDDKMNLFRPLNDTESAEETTSRASLRDSIRYTSPWTFQKAHTSDHAEVFLQDNELIYVKSGDSGRYLAVEVGVPSIVDRLNFMYVDQTTKPEDDGIRWTVR